MKLGFLFILSSFSSYASQNFFDLSLEELLNVKVNVSSRFDESVRKTPSSVTVFTGEEIDQLGISTLEELLGHVPGYVSSNLGDRAALSVRGTRSYAQVLLLIDGQRVNEAIFGGFLLTRVHGNLTNIDQVEIVRGPGSALYGANAFLGVINIKTKSKESYAIAELGSNNQKKIALSKFSELENHEFSIFGEFYDDEGYTYKSYRDTEGSGNGSVLTNRVIPHAKESISRFDGQIKYRYKDFYAYYNHAQREFRGTSTADGITYSEKINKSRPSSTSAKVGYRLDFKKGGSFDVGLGRSEAKYDVFGFRGTRDGFDYMTGSNQKEVRYRTTLDYKLLFSKDRKIALGHEYIYEDIVLDKSLTNFDSSGNHQNEIIDTGGLYPAPSIFSHGVYFQFQDKLFSKLSTTVGLRADDNSISGSALSPRAALVYDFTNDLTFKLLYGEAFRAPTFGELYQNSAVILANEKLRPEDVRTLEGVAIYDFESARVQLGYYISQFDDQIETIEIPSSSSRRFQLQNIGTVKREGLEVEVHQKLPLGFRTRLTFSHVFKIKRTEVSNPDHMTTGSFLINWNWNKLNMNLNSLYKKSYEGLDQSSLLITNLKISYNDKKSSYFFKVNNLGNREFLNTTFVRTHHQVNRGLMYSFGVKLNH